MSRLSAKQFARLAALLPQSRPLPGITAGRLVLHGRIPYLGYPRRYSREDREAARQAMERTGVAGLEGVPMAHLSGGQRQKVYLAMELRTPGGGTGGGTAAAGGCAGGELRLRRAGEGIPGPGPQRGDGEGGAAVPFQPAVRAEGGPPCPLSCMIKRAVLLS